MVLQEKWFAMKGLWECLATEKAKGSIFWRQWILSSASFLLLSLDPNREMSPSGAEDIQGAPYWNKSPIHMGICKYWRED